LKRVEASVLVEALKRICKLEGVAAEDEALAIIARAAEGSVRDSQSLLDQAISHGGATVTAATVRAMLGLADRGRIVDLFEAVMKGAVAEALAILKDLFDAGADPAVSLTDLAEFTHIVTRLKIVQDSASDASLTEVERRRGADFAGRLSIRTLSRAWQMLLKAIPEVQASPRPLAAAEMALVRLAHAADLPTPDEALRSLPSSGANSGVGHAPAPKGGDGGSRAALLAPSPRPVLAATGTGGAAPRPALPTTPPHPRAAAESSPRLAGLEDVVALARSKRDLRLADSIERDLRLVRFEEGRIEFTLATGGARTLANDVARRLQEWTGRRWIVALVAGGETAPTLREQANAAKEDAEAALRADPLVAAVLSRFPGAKIVRVTDNRAPIEAEATLEAEAAPREAEDTGENPPAAFDELAYDGDPAYTSDDL
jgi:DNA polymerase-3 subunit gamma/tau